ncbi:MAG: hypothetical protein VX640_04110 [Pseudomonadota bacterium]|nr:hypothetical protein [Pseudomonadota bacterium]
MAGEASKTVQPTLSPAQHEQLEQLRKKGYGKSKSEVARYLIQRELDDLIRAGVVKTDP